MNFAQVANAMHRSAFTHAFKVVCGFEDASIDEVEHHGMTVIYLPDAPPFLDRDRSQ